MSRLALVALVLASCKSRREARRDDILEESAPVVAKPADAAPAVAWPALAGLPRAAPVRSIALPTKADVPRFDVGGPALAGDLAIVASSQLGFAAVDWRRGRVAWTKPAGAHVAPPLVRGEDVVLIGECLEPPELDDHVIVLGCLRVVARDGTDRTYIAIYNRAELIGEFAATPGEQSLSLADRGVRWQRGTRAVDVDLATGRATAARATAPAEIEHDDTGRIVAAPGVALPGIGVLGRAGGAIAVRLDTSLVHDYVAAYTGARVWVWPLPELARPDAVGVAIAEDRSAVVVFHDGDTLSILPPAPASNSATP